MNGAVKRHEPPGMQKLMLYLLQPPQHGTITIEYRNGHPYLIRVEQSVMLREGAPGAA